MPKILIADDERGMRELLEQTFEELQEKGVELFTADKGEKALEFIQTEKPELVILDVMIPIMNGFEICNIVKNVLGMKDIYIIMLTAKGQEIDKQKGKDVGVNVYMTKPFDLDEIVEKAVEVLGIEP
ncbi:MAG: response regulator [Thermodesulfobacteriota bacterium]